MALEAQVLRHEGFPDEVVGPHVQEVVAIGVACEAAGGVELGGQVLVGHGHRVAVVVSGQELGLGVPGREGYADLVHAHGPPVVEGCFEHGWALPCRGDDADAVHSSRALSMASAIP